MLANLIIIGFILSYGKKDPDVCVYKDEEHYIKNSGHRSELFFLLTFCHFKCGKSCLVVAICCLYLVSLQFPVLPEEVMCFPSYTCLSMFADFYPQ